MQPSFTSVQPSLTACVIMSYKLCNCVLRLMELLVQLRLTACVTVSYGLWKWLPSSSPIYGNGCATQSYSLCNCVLQIVQLRLTAYGNG
jgi:hypothetical protein